MGHTLLGLFRIGASTAFKLSFDLFSTKGDEGRSMDDNAAVATTTANYVRNQTQPLQNSRGSMQFTVVQLDVPEPV